MHYTGDLSVMVDLDRETKDNYSVVVSASDGPNVGHVTVIVTVTDVNDNGPVWSADSLQVNITENQTPGNNVIGRLSATDADEGMNGTVTFFMNSTCESVASLISI